MTKRPLNLDDIGQEKKELTHPPLPPTDLTIPAKWDQYIQTLKTHLNQSEYMSQWEKNRWQITLEDAKRMYLCVSRLQTPLPPILDSNILPSDKTAAPSDQTILSNLE